MHEYLTIRQRGRVVYERFSIHYMPRIIYENSSETSEKREFSAAAILFSFAFSRTVVYHGLVESY